MEGFKTALQEWLKVEAGEWITQALLRELSKDETLKADFTGDFNSLTGKSKKLLIDLAGEVNISNDSGIVEREAKSYSFPWREDAYNLVDLVNEWERLSISQDRLSAVFSEYYGEEVSKDDSSDFVGPPDAPIEQKVSEVEDNEKGDEKPFDLADLPDFDNLSQTEKTKLVTQILDTDTPGQTLTSFITNPDKVSEWEGPMTDAWGVEFNIFFPDALPNTSEEDVYIQFPILVKYIEEGTYLRNDRNSASNW